VSTRFGPDRSILREMMMRRLIVAMTLLAALLPATASGEMRGMTRVAGDPVATTGGPVAGTRLPSGVRAYLGVPFAEPPVGRLRWAPPQPARWTGTWNADRRGPECIQVLRPHDINHYFGEEPTSEDCLTLNLWAPAGATARSRLPVVVFFYGGGFTIGSSGMANYDGEAVARAGAIFVNFNYRVGAFGFMAHPELSREQGGHSGNYGLMDQNAALRWVRDNIARFGGDPGQVVIAGQSAGAGSVASQIFSPSSRNLFRAAVMLSGCNYRNDGLTLAQAEQIGLQVQQRLGVDSLERLRDIPADRILAIQTENQVGARVDGIRIGGPIVDGHFLPLGKSDLLTARQASRVPIVAAYTSDDIDIAMNPISTARTVAQFREIARQIWGDDADGFLALYPVTSDANVPRVARDAARTGGFEAEARFCADAQRRFLDSPAYLAQFTRRHPYVPGVRIADQDIATIGAYHTADVPYWLGTLDKYNALRPTRNWTAWDRQLSATMVDMLISLARTGRPAAQGVAWPAWTPQHEVKLVLGDTITVAPLDPMRMDWHARHPRPSQFDPRSSRPRD
jgi:para-nitrobenzyl esterase